jgi:hypothetical protein
MREAPININYIAYAHILQMLRCHIYNEQILPTINRSECSYTVIIVLTNYSVCNKSFKPD